jgi:hypothetical protein
LNAFGRAAFAPAGYQQWGPQRVAFRERFPGLQVLVQARPSLVTAQKRRAGAGRVHDRHDDRVGDVMNVSSAPVDLIPAYVPLTFFK